MIEGQKVGQNDRNLPKVKEIEFFSKIPIPMACLANFCSKIKFELSKWVF